ncbi:MAG: adenylyltransferase/cytidyltransferase family protein [Patescibacteria group bacterium]
MSAAPVLKLEDVKNMVQSLRGKGSRIVFTVGAYDLIHSGQSHFLAEARTWGDCLVVGVASDASRRQLRGPGHPLVSEQDRAETLSYFRPVDAVTVVDERDLLDVLSFLQPTVFYTIEDDWKKNVRSSEEEELVSSYGGNVVKADRIEPFISSSEIVEKLARFTLSKHLNSFFGKEVLNIGREEPPFVDLGDQKPRDILSYAYLGEVVTWENLDKLRKKLRKENKSISFVSGSYDLVHVGHVRFIEKASEWGDVLVVGIPSDKQIKELKGPRRPIVSQRSRAELLRFFQPVDYVTVLPDSMVKALDLLHPDVFQTVDEAWNSGFKESPECATVCEYGGEIKLVERQAPFVSSQRMIEKAAGLRVRKMFSACLEAVGQNEQRS